MTDEEILKKLQIARDAWGTGAARGYSPYTSPSGGQEGYEDILKLKLDSLNRGYGKDYKYGFWDPMKHFTNADEIETLLGHEIAGLPPLPSGPSHFDLMRKDEVPVLSQEEIYAQQPPGGIGGGSGRNPIASLLEGPETANMQPSPYELSLLAEPKAPEPSFLHERGYVPFSGESIPGPEVTPLQQRRMNAQMVPGFYESFGGGHPDETPYTGYKRTPEQVHGYDQFSRQKGLLDSGTPGGVTKPKKIISKSKGVGWESDPVFDDDSQNAYRPNPMWGELIRAGADIYGGRRRR